MRTARLLPALLMFVAACGTPVKGNPPPAIIPVAPTITSTPANHAMNVPVSSNVVITASEALDPASIKEDSATLTGGDGASLTLNSALSADGLVWTLTPMGGLKPHTEYSLYVSGLKATVALGGLGLETPFQSSFTTGSTNPTIIGTTPSTDSNGVPTTIHPSLTFSEEMQDSTPSALSFVDSTNGAHTALEATITLDAAGKVVTVVPTAVLLQNHVYSVMVGAGFTSVGDSLPLVGAPVAGLKFTTVNVAAGVVSVLPAAGATDVPGDTQVQLTFSSQLDPSSINATNITLTDVHLVAVASTVTLDATQKVVTIVPTASLAPNITYILTATTGVKDSSGVPLTMNFNSTFTTKNFPFVLQVQPASAAMNVSVGPVISVIFNEIVGPLNANTVTVTPHGMTALSGTYFPDHGTANGMAPPALPNGTTITFLPDEPLFPGTTYDIAVTGVSDASGKVMAPYTSSFTTALYPIITQTDPPTGVAMVALGTAITVTFNEAVSPLNSTTFQVGSAVMDPMTLMTTVTPISGTVTTPGGVSPSISATFTPSAPLTASTGYAVLIDGVVDSHGTPLLAPFGYSFMTGM